MLLHFDNLSYKNWVTDVKLDLCRTGFVWEQQGVNNPQLCLMQYVTTLKYQNKYRP